jgi:2-C-methyl-D-erythritol 4-phosphate cytidylyltransferase
MKTIALIVAGGKSERFGGPVPKQYRELVGKPMLSWTISKFERASSIAQIVVVVGEEYLLHTSEKIVDPFGFSKVIKIVIGGETRTESVLRGLESLPISTQFVAIHDAARPLVSVDDIDRVVCVAESSRAAILAAPVADTIKRVRGDYVIATLDRPGLYQAQTPQVFQYDLIMQAHRDHQEEEEGISVTDDASLIEKRGFKVQVVEPSTPNFKITTADDLFLAEAILAREKYDWPQSRTGI